jgi:CRISPR-associated protein Cmr6
MKNLSWLFYKGYYQGFQYWNKIEKPDEKVKKDIAHFFEIKNGIFEKASLSDFQRVEIPLKSAKPVLLKTTYPGLLAGTGYSHGIGVIGEYKIGFHLDHITGLPIIPGSSVKGLLRSAFPIIIKEKKTGEYQLSTDSLNKEETKLKWIFSLIEHIEDDGFLTENIQPAKIEINQSKIDYLNRLILEIFEGVKDLDQEDAAKKYFSIYQRNIFFDSIPIKSENTGNIIFGNDSITPHPDPLKNPTPLLFLKVLPKVTFRFSFKLVNSSIEPKLTENNLLRLFNKILMTYGIGAKTNVGYGQFTQA